MHSYRTFSGSVPHCRPHSRVALKLKAALASIGLIAAVACSEDSPSPLAPETTPTTPELSASATAAPLQFRQVSTGYGHSCGVTTTNQAYCWGRNDSGELGDGHPGSGVFQTRPVPVAGGLQFRLVSAGADHSCGLTTDNRAYCWGDNTSGQVGDGTTGVDRSTPVAVAGGLQFSQIDAGAYAHTCAVNSLTKRAYCWGWNVSGQLGDGSFNHSSTPVAVASNEAFRFVSPGQFHTCGVTTGNRAYCWGSDGQGQLGDNTDAQNRPLPTLVAGGRSYRQLDAGANHTCAVTTGNRAFCWGMGRSGEIGDGKTFLRFVPQAVAGGHSFDRVSAGDPTCGETTDNRLYCWGPNSAGQLGDGTTTQRLTPVAVVGAKFFAQVSVGGGNTCGVVSSSTRPAYCWGFNGKGEVGDGTTMGRTRPTAVAAPM